jgi:hypothetical protein
VCVCVCVCVRVRVRASISIYVLVCGFAYIAIFLLSPHGCVSLRKTATINIGSAIKTKICVAMLFLVFLFS